jgi:glutathione S-transferase
MLKLYYSKGSSALAAHILLNEVGAAFEAVEISIPKGQHLSPEFIEKNPKGRVPSFETPDGVLTENPAILEYIAATHPQSSTLPTGHFAQAQARSLAAYLCATVHVAFAHKQRGLRWASQDGSISDMRSMVPSNLKECAALLEQGLNLDQWALGATYTYCDPYLFLVGQWLAAADIPIQEYPKLAKHRATMLDRPATQAAFSSHGLVV